MLHFFEIEYKYEIKRKQPCVININNSGHLTNKQDRTFK